MFWLSSFTFISGPVMELLSILYSESCSQKFGLEVWLWDRACVQYVPVFLVIHGQLSCCMLEGYYLIHSA